MNIKKFIKILFCSFEYGKTGRRAPFSHESCWRNFISNGISLEPALCGWVLFSPLFVAEIYRIPQQPTQPSTPIHSDSHKHKHIARVNLNRRGNYVSYFQVPTGSAVMWPDPMATTTDALSVLPLSLSFFHIYLSVSLVLAGELCRMNRALKKWKKRHNIILSTAEKWLQFTTQDQIKVYE